MTRCPIKCYYNKYRCLYYKYTSQNRLKMPYNRFCYLNEKRIGKTTSKSKQGHPKRQQGEHLPIPSREDWNKTTRQQVDKLAKHEQAKNKRPYRNNRYSLFVGILQFRVWYLNDFIHLILHIQHFRI